MFMVAAAGCFTVNDALCKWLMPSSSASEVIAFRGLVVVSLISVAAVLSRRIATELVFESHRLHAIRALLLGLSALLFLSGLAYLPLTNAVVLSFTSPLFVVALARPVLGEVTPPRTWIAVGAGFAGAVLVLEPTVGQFGWKSALPLCSAVTTALGDLLTRRMARNETSLSLVVSNAIGALCVGLISAIPGWRWIDGPGLATVGLAAAFVLASYYLTAESLRHGPASYVSPFRYSAMIWSLILSFIGWQEIPDRGVLIGAFIIISAGWYLARAR